jgi:NhaC family Na+:H+ antiporter
MKNKPLNPIYAYFVVTLTIMSIVVCMLLEQPILYAFLIILSCTFILSYKLGHSIQDLLIMMYHGMLKVKVVIIMLSLVGIMISLWMLYGTVPALIYYGFKYLADTNVVLSAFLISTVISMVIGTAIGTLSIVAPVFMGLAIGLNVPLPLIVGALVSGAYLGDRTSPVSSSVNLTALVTESSIRQLVRNIFLTNPVISSLKTSKP